MGESFSAQLSTGIANYSVPLSLLPSRGAASPSLSLSYSSSSGHGLAGVGWDVSWPSISRQTDRRLPRYNELAGTFNADQDRFVFGSGEELVPICVVDSGLACPGALSGEVMPVWAGGWMYFRARVEGGFWRFFWSSDHRTWIAQDKTGVMMELGVPQDGSNDENALESDPLHPTHIYRWNVAREGDPYTDTGQPFAYHNPVVYRYSHDGNMAYLSDVYDTPPVSNPTKSPVSSFAHHARLRYESRPDTSTSYRRGYLATQALRLIGVDVSSVPFQQGSSERKLARRYVLTYAPDFHMSLLASVQLMGRCESPAASELPENALSATEDASGHFADGLNCPTLPPLSFEYQHVDPYKLDGTKGGIDLAGYEGFDERLHNLSASPPWSLDDGVSGLFDINADALPDVMVAAPGSFGGRFGLYFEGQHGQSDRFWTSSIGISGVGADDATSLLFSNPNVVPLDVDGDGIINLLHMPKQKSYAVYTPRRVSGTAQDDSDTAKWTWDGRAITTAASQSPKIDFSSDAANVKVMDVNGDGFVDVVWSQGTEFQTFFALGRYPQGDGQFGHGAWNGPSAGSIDVTPVEACVPWAGTPVQLSDPDVHVSDMNGDGYPDIVRVRQGDLRYWPGRGDGTWGTADAATCAPGTFSSGYVVMDSSPEYSDPDGSGLRLDDVNGDGLDDLVQVRFQATDIWLNVDGHGWTPNRHIIDGTPSSAGFQNRVRLADMNGSGTRDILWGDGGAYKYIDLLGGARPWTLTHVDNGLGKTTDIAYESSVSLMLLAASQGKPWQSWAPMPLHVVTQVTDRDHLNVGGHAPGVYVTNYTYRDPVYDGRQRELRGFRDVVVERVGDANSPTSSAHSHFLLGECKNDEGLPASSDACAIANIWKDNPREALKGLPESSDTFDANGVYLSSQHTTYTLRKLYTGLDGREVRHAFASQSETWKYDTAAWSPAAASLQVTDVSLELTPGTPTTDPADASGPPTITIQAKNGTAHVVTKNIVDNFGNSTSQVALGCVDGQGCVQPNGKPGVDETITEVTVPKLVKSPSGWLWRSVESWTEGSQHGGDKRKHTVTNYGDDGFGQPIEVDGDFHRTNVSYDVQWFHETVGALVAQLEPGDVSAYGGGATTFISGTKYDSFGNPLWRASAGGKCTSMAYDSVFADLVTVESVFAGQVGSNGDCGGIGAQTKGDAVLTATASYDRGLNLPTLVHDIHGEPTLAGYDGFGRVTSLTRPDPNVISLSALPSMTLEYDVTANAAAQPYSIVHTRTQDGADPGVDSYVDAWAYVDGFGRTLLTLREADTTAGDGGDYVAEGLTGYDAKSAPERAYRAWFWSGEPTEYPLNQVPPSPYGKQRYDAFGRQVEKDNLDGSITLRTAYHAQSSDAYDAADLAPGPHYATYVTSREDGHGRDIATTERMHVNGKVELHETQSTYLPTGPAETITRVNLGTGLQVVRWMRYDSQDRMLLNAEPNTSQGFVADSNANDAALKAWRYAWNDAGELVAISDARGCGARYVYDAAGRILGEDYSPCQDSQTPYSDPDGDPNNYEVIYSYDALESSPDDSGCKVDNTLLLGRLTSVRDRGAHTRFRFDGRGRTDCVARQVTVPTAQVPDPGSLTSRYAPRWYHQTTQFDAADRPAVNDTGADVGPLEGSVAIHYSNRGTVQRVDGTYGTLVGKVVHDADGLVTHIEYGDAAKTVTDYGYDTRRRLHSVQTYRGPPPVWSSSSYPGGPGDPAAQTTFQLVLEDLVYSYDVVDNPIEIDDERSQSAWPAGAKPVSRKFQYDDLYRVSRVDYSYQGGQDFWTSPFDAEDQAGSQKVAPHVAFDVRALWQTTEYDWLGNTTKTDDDEHGFYDRSLGTTKQGAAAPYQLASATNGSPSDGPRTGALGATYDAAGNLTSLNVQRNGQCLPTSSSCTQNYVYEWDEMGRLAHAERLDVSDEGDGTTISTIGANLRFAYDANDQRVAKEGGDSSLYIFDSLELRDARYSFDGTTTDYGEDGAEEVYVFAHGTRLAHVTNQLEGAPTPSGAARHVLLEMQDHLGSTSKVLDKETGELVEASTYLPTGAPDSDYRTARWGEFREPYRTSNHEDDIEVGLSYAGKRYSSPYLGRWISADPLAVHQPGEADLNLYAVVNGRLLVVTDPVGLGGAEYAGGLLSGLVENAAAGVLAQVKTAVGHGGNAIAAAADGDWGTAAAEAGKQILTNVAFIPLQAYGAAEGVVDAAVNAPAHFMDAVNAKGDFESGRKASVFVGDAVVISTTAIGGIEMMGERSVAPPAKTPTPRPRPATRAQPRAPPRAATAAGEPIAEPSAPPNAPGACQCGTCFVAGTLVLTPQGEVAIEALRPGDAVLSRDVSTGVESAHPVEQVFETEDRGVVELVVEDESGVDETIRVTDNHPFWVVGLGWRTTRELRLGERIGAAAGRALMLVALESLPVTTTVYNLEVARDHTYFAGQLRALVHNGCPTNKSRGTAREKRTGASLEQESGPNAVVKPEVYLRNADGSIARPNGAKGRRIDHGVFDEAGNNTRLVETTSETANKAAQAKREAYIRGKGGAYVRNQFGESVPAAAETQTVRLP